MAKKEKMSNIEVAGIVDREGLGYAITSYMDSSDFEDKHLAQLWTNACEILNEIEEILEEACEAEGENEDDD